MPVVEGVVSLVIVEAGSKSEHRRPVVVDDQGGTHLIHVVGDNPFDEETLTALVGRRVRAEGTSHGTRLRVERDHLVMLEPEPIDGE